MIARAYMATRDVFQVQWYSPAARAILRTSKTSLVPVGFHVRERVRSVTLKTKSSTLERPIDKIVLLEGAAEVAEKA